MAAGTRLQRLCARASITLLVLGCTSLFAGAASEQPSEIHSGEGHARTLAWSYDVDVKKKGDEWVKNITIALPPKPDWHVEYNATWDKEKGKGSGSYNASWDKDKGGGSYDATWNKDKDGGSYHKEVHEDGKSKEVDTSKPGNYNAQVSVTKGDSGKPDSTPTPKAPDTSNETPTSGASSASPSSPPPPPQKDKAEYEKQVTVNKSGDKENKQISVTGQSFKEKDDGDGNEEKKINVNIAPEAAKNYSFQWKGELHKDESKGETPKPAKEWSFSYSGYKKDAPSPKSDDVSGKSGRKLRSVAVQGGRLHRRMQQNGANVNFPGGSVKVRGPSPGPGPQVAVKFPGGSVGVDPRTGVKVNFPGGGVNVSGRRRLRDSASSPAPPTDDAAAATKNDPETSVVPPPVPSHDEPPLFETAAAEAPAAAVNVTVSVTPSPDDIVATASAETTSELVKDSLQSVPLLLDIMAPMLRDLVPAKKPMTGEGGFNIYVGVNITVSPERRLLNVKTRPSTSSA